MPDAARLTIRETATLAAVKPGTIEKTVEAKVLRTLAGKPRLKGGAKRYLPLRAVAYFHALHAAAITDLPVRHKKASWRKMRRLEPMVLEPVEFSKGAILDVRALSSDCLQKAAAYAEARDRHIVSNSDILGGTPVISGTRLSVYAILGRLQGGDTIDDLVEDYPDIPREAFEAAHVYAQAHPLRGRPSGRPWRNAA